MLERKPPDRTAQRAGRERRRLARLERNPYTLSAASLAIIDRTARIDWFSAAGQPLADPGVRMARSIPDVKRTLLTDAYINVLIDARNDLTVFLSTRHSDRYSKTYSGITHAGRKLLQPTFDAAVARAKGLLGSLTADEETDLRATIQNPPLMALHEVEYADVFQADFGHRLLAWYERGRWPCGFEGEWPNVRIVVY